MFRLRLGNGVYKRSLRARRLMFCIFNHGRHGRHGNAFGVEKINMDNQDGQDFFWDGEY